MIKQFLRIFLPEKINDFFVLPLKRAGIIIEEDGISAVVFSAWKRNVSLTTAAKEPFSTGQESHEEKIQKALTEIGRKIGPCDSVATTLSSSYVLFKEMSFPFLSEEKIRLTLNYEIETLLPFSINEAAVNFIITNQTKTPVQSSIIAMAVKYEKVQECIDLFKKSSLELSHISLDSIGLYGLYAYEQENTRKEESVVLLDVKDESTQLMIMNNAHLRYIRSIPYGSSNLSLLIKEIQFTLISFMDNAIAATPISRAILFKSHQELEEKLKQEMHFECTIFDIQKFLTKINSKINPMLPTPKFSVGATAIAFPLSSTADFSMNSGMVNPEESSLLNMQFICALALSLTTIIMLASHAIIQTRKLSQELEKSQTEILDSLKKGFPHIKSKSLRDTLDITGREVKKEEGIWSSFSSHTRQSYLRYLYDMSTKIDRESLGLSLKKMYITQNAIALDGKVQSYEALEQLEHQLAETHLFTHIPDLQKIEFSVTLPLDEKGGE